MNMKFIFPACLFTLAHALPAYSQATPSQLNSRVASLSQLRSEAVAANARTNDKQYQPERDEPLKNNPRLARDLPARHLQQQQMDEKNIENAKIASDKFIDAATTIVVDAGNIDIREEGSLRQAPGLRGIIDVVKTQIRQDSKLSPTRYGDPAKLQALELAIEASSRKLDEVIKVAREKDEAARNVKTVEENAGQLVFLYAAAEVCYQANVSFSGREIEGVKSEVGKQLDALSISKQKRDEQWSAVQYAITQSGFRNSAPSQMSAECNNLRTNMTYAFPKVFLNQNQLPKNPF